MFRENSDIAMFFVIICALLLLSLALFVITLMNIIKQRKQEDLRRLNELTISNEKNLLNTKLLVQEETFQHISRDIHDNIGQKLTLARLSLNTIDFSMVDTVENQVKQTAEIISQCLSDLRDISRGLSTEQILNNGLYKALENEVNLINRSGVLKIRLNVTSDFDFAQAEKELLVFRIIQECLSNAMKHAKATEIKILLSASENLKTICVSDNGIGFNREKLSDSNGLKNIQSRVIAIGGELSITSVPDSGTDITIKIPKDEQQEV
jgi:signal transduction histidine kinase